MATIALIVICVTTVMAEQCGDYKRSVEKDPFLDLEKSMEKFVIRKFAKLATEVVSVRQELKAEIEKIVADHKAEHKLLQKGFEKRVKDSNNELIELLESFRKPCPSGYGKNAYGCYKVGLNEATWAEANATCSNEGAHLLSLESSGEINALIDLMKSVNASNHYHWTGLRKTNGEWTWTTEHTPSTYSNWRKGEPDGSGDCAYMYFDRTKVGPFELADGDCSWKSFRYVCEAWPGTQNNA